ncbi:Rid family detoxifying hydrolase [Peptoniphilus catoniae]|uniref:Rid family detoxifying hydrolase n=1 Tax=Peptoniphilus catoniae TaxID=1660341 RepID=UPI0015D57AB8
MKLEFTYTKKAPEAVGPYSQGAVAGGLIFTSGQLSFIPETGELILDDIKKATLQSLNNVKSIVESAGSSVDKIVKVNIFLKDINDFTEVNEVYADFFGDHKPARSCVEVAKLPKDGIIEIEAIAIK